MIHRHGERPGEAFTEDAGFWFTGKRVPGRTQANHRTRTRYVWAHWEKSRTQSNRKKSETCPLCCRHKMGELHLLDGSREMTVLMLLIILNFLYFLSLPKCGLSAMPGRVSTFSQIQRNAIAGICQATVMQKNWSSGRRNRVVQNKSKGVLSVYAYVVSGMDLLITETRLSCHMRCLNLGVCPRSLCA